MNTVNTLRIEKCPVCPRYIVEFDNGEVLKLQSKKAVLDLGLNKKDVENVVELLKGNRDAKAHFGINGNFLFIGEV